MNDWLKTLTANAKKHGYRRVCTRLGISQTTLSQVLSQTYKGNLRRIQQLVEGTLMDSTVECPVLGEIPTDQCIKHQSRINDFAATNPTRVQLHKTCPDCPNRVLNGGDK